MVLIFFAPESPWWLTRKGRTTEALKSLKRLGNKTENHEEKLAMITRTVEIEAKLGGNPTLLDLFKGTDLRRTTITCLMYASQNFAGNLIANQATFFFERRLSLPDQRKSSTDNVHRSRHVPRLRLPTRPNKLLRRLRCQRLLMVPNRLVRPPHNLPLGHSRQRDSTHAPRHLRFDHPNPSDELRPSRAGDLDLDRIRGSDGSDLLLHHRGSFFSSAACFEYGCWARRVSNPCLGISSDLQID